MVRRPREVGQAGRGWLKRTLLAEVGRRAILAQEARLGPSSDIPDLPPLVAGGARAARPGAVLADAGLDPGEGPRYVREAMGAMGVVAEGPGEAHGAALGPPGPRDRLLPQGALPPAPPGR